MDHKLLSAITQGDYMQKGNVRGCCPVSGVNCGSLSSTPSPTILLECEGKGIKGGSEAQAR